MALLSVDKVSKNFGGLQALHNVTFDVEEGKITALIGPNGAGKTTMFNMVTGMDRVTSGQMSFAGKRIEAMRPYDITHLGIARTFQLIKMFKGMTVQENVMVGRHTRAKTGTLAVMIQAPSARREEAEIEENALEMLRFVKLEHRAREMASALPYGQQRLVEMARALASDPRLLLLDEPVAGLNPQETEVIQKMLRSVQALGITILMIEHDMRMVMNISDKVVVLNYGEKIAEGRPDEVSRNPTVVKAYLGKEYGRASA